MTTGAIALLSVCIIAILGLPRRLAPLPLLVCVCYMTIGQKLEIGQASFTVVRILIYVGVIRVVIRRESVAGGLCRMDRLMFFWVALGLIASAFHNDPLATLVNYIGSLGNAIGVYLLTRCFCQSEDDVVGVVKTLAYLLVPLAAEMIYEQYTGTNLFAVFGRVAINSVVRDGRIRAQGPFAHAILSGTVGAICLPLLSIIWNRRRGLCIIGSVACLVIIAASASSGPIVSVLAGLAALAMWRYRGQLYIYRWMVVWLYVILDVVMKSPPYYLLARIDLVGGSTGWHRAALIQSSLSHLNEWALWGTDYTRHWMPTGVFWSSEQTDITNQYLVYGIMGGLPFLLLFFAILWSAFVYVGSAVRQSEVSISSVWPIWALGCTLFAITVTGISVSFFDQSSVLVFMVLGMIGSCRVESICPATLPAKTLSNPT